MRGGHVDAVSRVQVSGWAADSTRPDTCLELCIRVNGVESGRVTADRRRQDLAALGRYGDGRHGFTFAFPGPLAAHLDHVVGVYFADDHETLPGGERVVPRDAAAARSTAPSGPAPAAGFLPEPEAGFLPEPEAGFLPEPEAGEGPNPILVTAPGRSGTTFLMACLAASPQVVVAELIPYEVRLLSYYAAAYGVLTAPADTERSTHPDRLEGDGYHVGFNPFTGPQYTRAFHDPAPLDELHQLWAPARLGAALADIVREYYRRLALDRGKGAVPFFAEKNNNLNRASRMFVRRVFATVREVVIVRDPRDVLCSHVAYFESTQDKAFAQLTHSCRQLARLADTAGGALHVLRYEDMVRGDADTFARLSAFLGAAVTPVAPDAGEKMFRQHATSRSPGASIGRWRHDLPATLRAQSAVDWATFLARFGYDPE